MGRQNQDNQAAPRKKELKRFLNQSKKRIEDDNFVLVTDPHHSEISGEKFTLSMRMRIAFHAIWKLKNPFVEMCRFEFCNYSRQLSREDREWMIIRVASHDLNKAYRDAVRDMKNCRGQGLVERMELAMASFMIITGYSTNAQIQGRIRRMANEKARKLVERFNIPTDSISS